MAKLNISNELMRGLGALDKFLAQKGLHLDVLLVGANGMRSQNLISRASRDLDNHNEMSALVEEAIVRIAAEQGLRPDWLNDNASSIALPDGAAGRTVAVEAGFKNIAFMTLSRQDFICMKVAAAAVRMEDTTRDIDDLREAKVSVEEFNAALNYVAKYHQPDDAEFIAHQKRDISELRRFLFGS